MTDELAEGILAARAKAPESEAENAAPFHSISDFLVDETVWEGMSESQRLGGFAQMANLVTVNSQVFLVQAQNQVPADTGQRRPSISRIRSLMLVDAEGRATALNWKFQR